jgi:hypothetical protein
MHPVFYCNAKNRWQNGREPGGLGRRSSSTCKTICGFPEQQRIKMIKRLPPLPRRLELALFAIGALGCALLTVCFKAHDLALAILAVPIFMVCAWLGMKRSGQWQSFTKSSDAPPSSAIDAADVADLP